MKNKYYLITAMAFTLLTGIASHANEDKWEMPNMTSEQRMKMADSHEKMAACMRSTKPMKDCHDEMMKVCEDTMGKDCPMGKMHHHKM